MYPGRCVELNLKSVLILISIFILNGIKQSETADNYMEDTSKAKVEKNNNIVDNNPKLQKNQTEFSQCNSYNVDCNTLEYPCIRCNLNNSCTYGKNHNVNCDALVSCTGNKSFIRQITCRYCFLSDPWEYDCVQRGNCNSIQNYYKTNCTVHNNVICLGNRTFSKNIKCNWTQGYRWSTALIISLTLGGFGADRFYLGHWQEGIGKLFSFGGLGVWTIIDVLLISLHYLGPADGSLYI